MTTIVTTRTPAGAAVGPLAEREAWRIVRHPIYLAMLVYFVILGGVQAAGGGLSGRETVRELLVVLGLLWFGPATFFAANLVASSARRSHAESQLAAAPTTAYARTLAACLGVLGPTAAAAAFAAIVRVVEHAGGSLDHAQGIGELAVIPLCTLGGGLLGVAVAEWMPWRGAPLIVLFALLAWVVAVMDRGELQWTAPWTMSRAYYKDAQLSPGSPGWHAAYLLGLALLAGVAAVLRHPSHRRPLLVFGAMVLIATLVAGWVQVQ
jgi:hypothetical protein